jgi:hypothetical protein
MSGGHGDARGSGIAGRSTTQWTDAHPDLGLRRRARRRGADAPRVRRPPAARSCHQTQFPHRRALPVLVRSPRRAAAAVHRHRQRRGAPVLSRPAPLDLRVGQKREQLLRVRLRQRLREHAGVRHHPAKHVPLRRRADARTGLRLPGGEGARGLSGAQTRLPAEVHRQHLGDELRLALRDGRRGDQSRG